jgi:predicted PurR-regulated permease PerM
MEWPSWISKDIAERVQSSLSNLRLSEVISSNGFADQAITALNQAWEVFADLLGVLGAAFGIVSYFLYLVFIMLDYPLVSEGWRKYIPQQYKRIIFTVIDDMEEGMNGYFMAMTKIVFWVAILFVIGFKLIGLPFAILLGITLGIMNYIPYSQLFGIIPAIGLSALHSLETGANFWMLLGLVLLVFVVVQLIQDLYLTPKFMGEFSGFNPAIILLSLSIWGSLLGLIGVIIAIPLTSILITYYKRYILDKSR